MPAYSNQATTLLRRYEDSDGNGITAATITCLVGATSGALPTVSLTVAEVGEGYYSAAHTFVASGEYTVRWGASSVAAMDGRDEIFTVWPTSTTETVAAPSAPSPATAIEQQSVNTLLEFVSDIYKRPGAHPNTALYRALLTQFLMRVFATTRGYPATWTNS